MDEYFKAINERLDKYLWLLSLYIDKINRINDAIDILKGEYISIPESLNALLRRYNEFYKLKLKDYNELLELRDMKVNECEHEYEITKMGDGRYYNIGRCVKCGHVEYIKDYNDDD